MNRFRVTSPANGIDLDTFIKDRIAYDAAGNISNTGLPIFSYVLGGKANHGPNMYAPSYKDFCSPLRLRLHTVQQSRRPSSMAARALCMTVL